MSYQNFCQLKLDTFVSVETREGGFGVSINLKNPLTNPDKINLLQDVIRGLKATVSESPFFSHRALEPLEKLHLQLSQAGAEERLSIENPDDTQLTINTSPSAG